MKNKLLLTILIFLIPSIGWGMKCKKVKLHGSSMALSTTISRCANKEVICHIYQSWEGSGITCFEKQGGKNDK